MGVQAWVMLLEECDLSRCFTKKNLEKIFAQGSCFKVIFHRLVTLNVGTKHFSALSLATKTHKR